MQPALEDAPASRARRWLARVCLTGTALMLIILASSAALRLSADSCAGTACEPGALGRTGMSDAAERTARLVHRIAASTMGMIAAAVMLLGAMRVKQSRLDAVLAATVLALTFFLAVLGRQAGGNGEPAFILGNVLAGTALLLLLFWLYLRNRVGSAARCPPGYAGPLGTLAVGGIYFALGTLLSAHGAAGACPSAPACLQQWDAVQAFHPLRHLELQLPAPGAQAARRELWLGHRAAGLLLIVLLARMAWMQRTHAFARDLATAGVAVMIVQSGLAALGPGLRDSLPPRLLHDLLSIAVVLLLVALGFRSSGAPVDVHQGNARRARAR